MFIRDVFVISRKIIKRVNDLAKSIKYIADIYQIKTNISIRKYTEVSVKKIKFYRKFWFYRNMSNISHNNNCQSNL